MYCAIKFAQMKNIKNIIFDLGGVILNIDFKQSELAFAGLGIGNFNQYYTLQALSPLFEQLETGLIKPEDFYNEFRTLAKVSLSNEEIKNAWNALLLNFPKERIEWLRSISKKYKIYLLSNTNQIHYNSFIETYKKEFNGEDFESLFVKAYYSHQLNKRKPNKDCFEAVLQNEKLVAEETLFIDDSIANIEGAQLAGLQTIHLHAPKTILELNL